MEELSWWKQGPTARSVLASERKDRRAGVTKDSDTKS